MAKRFYIPYGGGLIIDDAGRDELLARGLQEPIYLGTPLSFTQMVFPYALPVDENWWFEHFVVVNSGPRVPNAEIRTWAEETIAGQIQYTPLFSSRGFMVCFLFKTDIHLIAFKLRWL